MTSFKRGWLPRLFVLSILTVSPAWAQSDSQTKAQPTQKESAPPTDVQTRNVQAYIDLLRRDVRQEKAEIMGSMMLLSAGDASKFWPIYEQYDLELTKLNDQRIENIKEYARSYDQLTDQKADELVQNAMTYQRQRAELLADTYGKVKQALGAVTAARFAQIENQLLMLIDLQITSSLPLAGQNS
jgi:hypothetical protein